MASLQNEILLFEAGLKDQPRGKDCPPHPPKLLGAKPREKPRLCFINPAPCPSAQPGSMLPRLSNEMRTEVQKQTMQSHEQKYEMTEELGNQVHKRRQGGEPTSQSITRSGGIWGSKQQLSC